MPGEKLKRGFEMSPSRFFGFLLVPAEFVVLVLITFYMWEIKKKRAYFSSRETLLSQKPISKIDDNKFLKNNQGKI